MAKVFFVYSHKDESFRDQLETHLSPLKRFGTIETWHDRKIGAGRDIDRTIDRHLEAAHIILLLISADFIASDYCYEVEMTRALERHAAKEATVLPVILRQCAWRDMPFSRLRAVPLDGTPIATFKDPDAAFAQVAEAIREAAESFTNPEADPPPRPAAVGRRPPASPDPTHRPLRIRQHFTDSDRDTFLEDAFQYAATYFDRGTQMLMAAHPQVEARFRRVSAGAFTSKVYVRGSAKAECAVWTGQDFGNGIAFSWDASMSRGYNEHLTIADDGYGLHLRPLGMQRTASSQDALTKEQAAEFLWHLFTRDIES